MPDALQPDAKIHRFGPPTGGTFTRVTPTKLASGQYAMLRNVELVDDTGAFRIRKGTKQFNTTSLGSGPIRGIARFIRSSSSETLFVWNGNLYRLGATPTLIADVDVGTFAVNDEVTFVFFENRAYAFSAARNMRYDGTDLQPVGFSAPASFPASDGGAGSLTAGTYQYAITAYFDNDTTHESAPVTTNITTVGTRQINLTISSTTLQSLKAQYPSLTGFRVYRTKRNETTYFFRSTNNPPDFVNTFVITDNTADTALDTARKAPFDNLRPPFAKHAILWKGRLVLANVSGFAGSPSIPTARGPSRIVMSAVASTERNTVGTISVHGAHIEIFPNDHWIDVGDDNTPITGLAVLADALVIFKENEVWMLRGDSASDMRLWKTGSATGCVAPRSIVNMGELGIFFLGRGSTTPMVYAFNGLRAEPMGDAVEPTFRSKIVGLGSSYSVQPSAVRYRDQYILCYAKDATPTYEIAKYDPIQNRWSFDDNVSASCWVAYVGPGDAGEAFFGSALAGWVAQWDIDGGDFSPSAPSNPTDAQMYIESGWEDFGLPHAPKQTKWVYIIADVPASFDGTLTATRYYDFETTGTAVGASLVTMLRSFGGVERKVFAFRVEGQAASGTFIEQGYRIKVAVTVDVAYSTTGQAYKQVRIHDFLCHYIDFPPASESQQ